MRIVFLVLFAAIPAFRAASAEPVRMTGEVLIQNNGPKTVLAFIQPNSGGVSQVLRLTAQEPFPQNPVAFHFDDAEVVLDADHAAIVSRSSDVTIVFALSEPMNPEPAAASDLLPTRDESKGRIRRNLTGELQEGASDGALKKPAPNWSNRVADATDSARRSLSHVEGGFDWSEVEPDKEGYTRGYVRGS